MREVLRTTHYALSGLEWLKNGESLNKKEDSHAYQQFYIIGRRAGARPLCRRRWRPDRRRAAAGTAERVGLLGLALAEDLRMHGREVLLFLDELVVTPAAVERLLARQSGATAALTTFILQHKTPADQVPAGALGALLRDGDGRI